MARKRVVEPSGVKTWEDANDALRQIAEAQLAVQDIEGEMNKQILGAKKAAEEQSKPHKDRIAKLERELKDFVTEHRADMGKAKSKILTFGEVGFRLSTSVSLPRAKEKIEEIIRRLKNRQMMDCIVIKEDISKEALKKYGEDTVNAVGAMSPARPSPSTGQSTSAASSPEAATGGITTGMPEEHLPITSGTGSSPARKSSPDSLPRFPLTWTPTSTRPITTVPIISFGIGWACIPGVKRPGRRTRRPARTVGPIRPAAGTAARPALGTCTSVSAPSLKS